MTSVDFKQIGKHLNLSHFLCTVVFFSEEVRIQLNINGNKIRVIRMGKKARKEKEMIVLS